MLSPSNHLLLPLHLLLIGLAIGAQTMDTTTDTSEKSTTTDQASSTSPSSSSAADPLASTSMAQPTAAAPGGSAEMAPSEQKVSSLSAEKEKPNESKESNKEFVLQQGASSKSSSTGPTAAGSGSIEGHTSNDQPSNGIQEMRNSWAGATLLLAMTLGALTL